MQLHCALHAGVGAAGRGAGTTSIYGQKLASTSWTTRASRFHPFVGQLASTERRRSAERSIAGRARPPKKRPLSRSTAHLARLRDRSVEEKWKMPPFWFLPGSRLSLSNNCRRCQPLSFPPVWPRLRLRFPRRPLAGIYPRIVGTTNGGTKLARARRGPMCVCTRRRGSKVRKGAGGGSVAFLLPPGSRLLFGGEKRESDSSLQDATEYRRQRCDTSDGRGFYFLASFV